MILTIDVGNSNTVVIGYDNDEVVYRKRMITEKKNVKEYYQSMFDINEKVEQVVLSCVVPAVYEVLIKTMDCIKVMEGTRVLIKKLWMSKQV